MKKIISGLAILGMSLTAQAQESNEPLIDRGLVFDMVNICAVAGVIYLISSFILQIARQNFDYRLKIKILEKGTAENIVNQIVQPKKDARYASMQWFFVLIGIGLGFTIISLTRPFGLHSLAIMAFCIAAGIGAFYFFSGNRKNDSPQ
jgi:hypothetical protein